MIDRTNLWQAGADALHQLGLSRWKIWYTDEEPETVLDHQPAPGTGYNVRFNIITDDGRFLNLRLRIAAEHLADARGVREWLASALVSQIRRDHVHVIQ